MQSAGHRQSETTADRQRGIYFKTVYKCDVKLVDGLLLEQSASHKFDLGSFGLVIHQRVNEFGSCRLAAAAAPTVRTTTPGSAYHYRTRCRHILAHIARGWV